MDRIKVKGNDNLIRDPQTNSIINTNMTEYNEYISKRNSKIKDDEKIQDLESSIDGIKRDLNEIKDLIRSMINESR